MREAVITFKLSKVMKKSIEAFCKKYEVSKSHFIRGAILRELVTDK
jgi:hypothetical protein